jgi:Mn-dependent DtxR family transcriptional regulator
MSSSPLLGAHQITEDDRRKANALLSEHRVALTGSSVMRETIARLEEEADQLEAHARNKMKEAEALLLHPACRK